MERDDEKLTITVRGRCVTDPVLPRVRAPAARPTHEQFVAGIRNLLAAEDRLDEEVRDHDVAEGDPVERWA